MNVISYEKAYSLFPQATLEEKRTLVSVSSSGHGRRADEGLSKYASRGFDVLYYLPFHDTTPDPTSSTAYQPAYHRAQAVHGHGGIGYVDFASHPYAFGLRSNSDSDANSDPALPPSPAPTLRPRSINKPAFQLGWRWIDDACSWTLALPLDGVAPPLPTNRATPALAHDPVAVCNWEMQPGERHPGASVRGPGFVRGVLMKFEVAVAKVLWYKYLVTDRQLLEFLANALHARMQVEERKEAMQLEDWS